MNQLRFYPALLPVLLMLTSACGCADTKTSFRDRLDKIIPQKGEEFDFTKTVVELTMITDTNADREYIMNEIGKMTSEAATFIADEGDYEKIIEKLNVYFFRTRGFSFDLSYDTPERAASPDAHSLERLLRKKRGICMNMSLLYLIISDRLGLPMKGVLIPGHIYVRCEPPGRSGINIETTVSGAEYYGYGAISGGYRNSAEASYGRALDTYGVLGAYLSNISIYFLNNNRADEAEACAEKAAEMLPGAAEPLISLAIIKSYSNNFDAAEGHLIEALKISPDYGPLFFMLGKTYISMKRRVKAVESLEKALILSPELKPQIDEELKKAELL